MRGSSRHSLQRRRHYIRDLLVADFARGTRPGLIGQTVKAPSSETLAPRRDRDTRNPQAFGDHEIWQAGGGQQHDLRAHSVRSKALSPPRPRFQFSALRLLQLDAYRRASRHSYILPSANRIRESQLARIA
jgi:hypothetical protein